VKVYHLFNHFAPLYDRLTDNRMWRASLREMARHLPPSGSVLRVLDAGCGPANSARTLAELRPDAHIVGLDASRGMLRRARRTLEHDPLGERIRLAQAALEHIPLPDSSLDAIVAHSVFYMLNDQPAFLAEALRILRPGGRLIMLDPARTALKPGILLRVPRAAPSLLLWNTVSRAFRSCTPESLARTLEAAGFARILGERAVEGFGILSRGEKPYPLQSPPERTAVPADAEPGGTLQPLNPARGLENVLGRALFLLIKAMPNKPAWALTDGDVITWAAAAIPILGIPTALAFSALPKAVAFMQAAIRENRLIGINKVAKFDRSTAARWDFPILLNPPPEALQTGLTGTSEALWIGIDPRTAVGGEE
jgi:SAM-dependent methyltransferase